MMILLNQDGSLSKCGHHSSQIHDILSYDVMRRSITFFCLYCLCVLWFSLL